MFVYGKYAQTEHLCWCKGFYNQFIFLKNLLYCLSHIRLSSLENVKYTCLLVSAYFYNKIDNGYGFEI